MIVSACAASGRMSAAPASSEPSAPCSQVRMLMPSLRPLFRLRPEMPRDLGAGGFPDAIVTADIAKRRIESVDPVRHAGKIGMDRDRHHAAGLGALAIEHVELAADHLLEFGRRAMRPLEHRLVVDLLAVGHGNQPLAAVERHQRGLVVMHPIGHVFAAIGGEQIDRVPGLLQAGAEPADRTLPRSFLDGRERAMDDASLFVGRHLVEPARVGLVVAHPLPAKLVAFLDDRRMLHAQIAVERHRGADAVTLQHLHQAENADAVAVVADRPGRHIGDRRAGSPGRGRHFLLQREELDVGDDPERDMGAVGPAQPGPADDGRIGKRAVGGGLHLRNRSLSSPSSPLAPQRLRDA